ncbi:hypothetical protein F5884DRAFT_772945 [Xylogone sp. PMI_703]|nr:hypothetical protein F5884DRAFT_772945 [Xylogone sp. PMI_703]
MASQTDGITSLQFHPVSFSEIFTPSSEYDADGNQVRKRRRHEKSRQGCMACRRRRVKCDETRPECRNCIKRKEPCSLLQIPLPAGQRKLGPPKALSLNMYMSDDISPCINMLHMKMLHHFNTVTAHTLVFDTHLWQNEVMQLAFQYEFLMQAILLISATHLAYLNPLHSIYQRVSMVHLSKTLSLFRMELSRSITIQNADALIATSVLLVHHAWTSIDILQDLSTDVKPRGSSEQTFTLDLSIDPLFSLCDGLRDIFIHSIILINNTSSIFSSSAAYRPRYALLEAIHDSNILTDLETMLCSSINLVRDSPISTSKRLNSEMFLSYWSHRVLGTRGEQEGNGMAPRPDEEEDEALLDASSRVALILAMCRNRATGTCQEFRSPTSCVAEDGRTLPPLCDLTRYIFSFPPRSSPKFVALVRRNDPSALLILALFYRATDLLLSTDKCWWTRARAGYLQSAIEHALKADGKAIITSMLSYITV